MLMMIMCPVWQDREDALLRDTDSASHPHRYLHLTHVLTLHLLLATCYVCLLFSLFEAMSWLDGGCKKQMARRARCNPLFVLAPHHAARQRRSSPHGNRHSTRAEGKYGSQETPDSGHARDAATCVHLNTRTAT